MLTTYRIPQQEMNANSEHRGGCYPQWCLLLEAVTDTQMLVSPETGWASHLLTEWFSAPCFFVSLVPYWIPEWGLVTGSAWIVHPCTNYEEAWAESTWPVWFLEQGLYSVSQDSQDEELPGYWKEIQKWSNKNVIILYLLYYKRLLHYSFHCPIAKQSWGSHGFKILIFQENIVLFFF